MNEGEKYKNDEKINKKGLTKNRRMFTLTSQFTTYKKNISIALKSSLPLPRMYVAAVDTSQKKVS